MSNNALQVTDQTFEHDVLNADQPVLVDFWAEWCGPCHAVAPVVEELAQEYEGRIKVKKLNVDENPDTAQRYHIRSIPALILFQDGEAKETTVGVQSKSRLSRVIEPYL